MTAKPETGIKDRFEDMEYEIPFGTFRPGKQNFLFRRSVSFGNFPLERPEKSCSIYFPNGFSQKRFVNGKQPGVVYHLQGAGKQLVYGLSKW